MKWKDYKYGSWLVIVFGQKAAKLDVLGYSASGVENHFGLVVQGVSAYKTGELLPGSAPGGGDYTRDTAKAFVEALFAEVSPKASVTIWHFR